MPPAANNNATGFWELAHLAIFNGEMLRELGSRWDD